MLRKRRIIIPIFSTMFVVKKNCGHNKKMENRHCINGQEITADVHNKLKEDCRFYMEQCVDGHTDIYLNVSPSGLANLIQYVAIPEDDYDRNLQFILKKPLVVLFDMLELLHYMMSTQMKYHLMLSLKEIAQENPAILDGIKNEFYFFEREYIEKLKASSITSVVFVPYPYHFKDDLWIDIKVVLFKICIVRCLGFLYLHVGDTNTLYLMEPQNEIQRRMLSRSNMLIPRHIEYANELAFGDAINMSNCKLNYTNESCHYRGAIRIDEVLGFQRHGIGNFYAHNTLEAEGRYLFNRIDYTCIWANERDILCDCTYCSHDDDEEDVENRCNFHHDRSDIIQWMDEEHDFTSDERLCDDCRSEMYENKRSHQQRQVEMFSRIFDLDLTAFDMRNSFLHEILYEEIQTFQAYGDFVEIKTFDDYIKYIDAPVDTNNFEKLVEHLRHTVSEFRNGRGRYYG